MAYWAQIDENNVVTNVVVTVDDDKEATTWLDENYGGTWLKTDRQTDGGVHYDPETGEPSADQSLAFRKNFAGIGYVYDEARDAFILGEEGPHPSWVLDEETCKWVAPVPKPDERINWAWMEETLSWELVD